MVYPVIFIDFIHGISQDIPVMGRDKPGMGQGYTSYGGEIYQFEYIQISPFNKYLHLTKISI